MEQVPGSTILLKARGLRNDRVKERILAAFAARGIAGESRIQLMGHERSAVDHLRLYNQMDLALDTFPYNGTTTTCEALWMGVPVVSLAGQQSVSRAGWSQLSNLGLPELVAFAEEDYIRIATQLAGDWPRLAELSNSLPLTSVPR